MSLIQGFETFISDDFISSRKCPILMVDPALDSLDSELLKALFDVFTAFFPADLSRVYCRHPLGTTNTSEYAHTCLMFLQPHATTSFARIFVLEQRYAMAMLRGPVSGTHCQPWP